MNWKQIIEVDLGLLRHLVWISLWQWLTPSILPVECCCYDLCLGCRDSPAKQTGRDDKAFQLYASPILKVDSKR